MIEWELETKKSDLDELLAEPTSVEETGLSMGFLSDMIIKMLYYESALSGFQLADGLKLPFHQVVEDVLEFMRREKLCEIRGSGETLVSGSFQYVITGYGRERAREVLERNQYVGPAPIPLTLYGQVVQAQRIRDMVIGPEIVEEGLSHLVVPKELRERIGPAVNSGQSLFLYGLPGNGKTVIAEAIGSNMLIGNVYVPYAVEIDGQVITVFDPLTHERIEDGEAEETLSGRGSRRRRKDSRATRKDARWELCERPVVVAGGELVMDSLDLNYNEVAKYYEAPLQMKANGGVFLIDDFGRQLIKPRDLLNRWIVPLEKHVDFLTLHTGKKIAIPFEELIIFSTNLDPKSLVDEAFLRRIRHKILVSNPTFDQYRVIFQRMCDSMDVAYDEQVLVYLLETYYVKAERGLRACHPRDLLSEATDIARYLGLPNRLTEDLIDRACDVYFANI
jgi:predicted ATPase with chaperone activity